MLTKPPGVEDIFPDRIMLWNHITRSARRVFNIYNFQEVILPVMEYTELFSRGLGDETDIVSKEMFTFEDRGNRSLTLRPEGTAGVVRAYVENGEYNRLSSCKFFYIGPMFRAERPQKGRLRQFNQLGAEFFGSDDPYYDYEVISLIYRLTRELAIPDYKILLNSIGCPECRPTYLKNLKEYYYTHKTELCPDCQRRLEKNPLRLLDCKTEGCSRLKLSAPKITDYLCEGCSTHYTKVKDYLNREAIPFTEDTNLVRGLDYYCKTTFEFVTTALGGQNAFAAGGRYNQLVEKFGGKPTPAVGFAAGIERMFLLLEKDNQFRSAIDAYIIHGDGESLNASIQLIADLRKAGLSAEMDPSAVSFKNQFKKADREGARFTVIVGEDEVASGKFTLKNLSTGEQQLLTKNEIISRISEADRG